MIKKGGKKNQAARLQKFRGEMLTEALAAALEQHNIKRIKVKTQALLTKRSFQRGENMVKNPSEFTLRPILSGEDFVENFKEWINYGESVGLLQSYEAESLRGTKLHPQISTNYLYLVFLNELKREGQNYKLLEEDIYQSFVEAFPEGLKLSANLNDRIAKDKDRTYLCFPGFVREAMSKKWLQPWRDKKQEPISKRRFYKQIWKLFFFELQRQKIISTPRKRKSLFDEFWPNT